MGGQLSHWRPSLIVNVSPVLCHYRSLIHLHQTTGDQGEAAGGGQAPRTGRPSGDGLGGLCLLQARANMSPPPTSGGPPLASVPTLAQLTWAPCPLHTGNLPPLPSQAISWNTGTSPLLTASWGTLHHVFSLCPPVVCELLGGHTEPVPEMVRTHNC